MAIVLPDGILTNATLQYVRDFIMNNFKINAIVSIPQTAFSHYGAGVKCSLLFLTKSTKNKENEDIFMAQAEYVGYDATGREIEQNDLNEIFNNYKNFIEKKNFKLNDKCFLIKFNNVKNNRIDPFYIKFKLSLLKGNSFKFETLENILYMERGITYSKDSERDSGLAVLRAGNITLETNQINFDDIKYLDNTLEFPKEKKLKKNDIFICTNSGSKAHIGKVAFIQNDMDYYFGGFMGVLRVKNIEKYNPYYIFTIFTTNYVKNLIELLIANTTINNLNFSDISEIPIPIPPIETQNKIVNIMKDAYLSKEKLEKEADKLLSSIDEYLLRELGITLPKKDTNFKSRIIITKLSYLKGKRIDYEYHQKYYIDLQNAICKSKYPLVSLSNKISVNSQLENMKKYNFINYIDLSCIEKNNGIVKNIVFMNKDFPSRARQRVGKGDLLVSTLSGSMKAIAIVEEDKENLIASTGFFVIKETDKDLLKYFLISILRTNLFQELLKREARGAIMSSINCNDFLNIEIPLPPIEIQQKIVNEINERKQKALRLQKEAKEILEDAKSQVERIIF